MSGVLGAALTGRPAPEGVRDVRSYPVELLRVLRWMMAITAYILSWVGMISFSRQFV